MDEGDRSYKGKNCGLNQKYPEPKKKKRCWKAWGKK